MRALASPSPLKGLGFLSLEGISQVFVCACLPLVLFVSHAVLGYVAGINWTLYFPLLVVVGSGFIVRFKVPGLIATMLLTCGLFISQKSYGLWHLAHMSALELSWIIAYLCYREIETLYLCLQEALSTQQVRLEEITHMQSVQQRQWEEIRDALEHDLERLKEEAEQRRIEQEEEHQNALLMRTEIDLLTSQKEAILLQAQHAQETYVTQQAASLHIGVECKRLEHQLLELEKWYHSQDRVVQSKQEEAERLAQEIEKIQVLQIRQTEKLCGDYDKMLQDKDRLYTELAQQLDEMRQLYEEQALQMQAGHECVEAVEQEQKIKLEQQLAALQVVHDEHVMTLQYAHQQQVKELEIRYKQTSEAMEQQQQALGRELETLQQDYYRLQATESTRQEALKQQIDVLTAAHQQQLHQVTQEYQQHLQAEQHTYQQLLQQLESLQVTHAEQTCGISKDLERDYAKVQGLYKQLRMQFEEKSHVLDQTRKQLFRVEGELEAVKRKEEEGEQEIAKYEELKGLWHGFSALIEDYEQASSQLEDLEILLSLHMRSV